MKIDYKRPKEVKLWLTPIIDMLITVMIFLLLGFAPEEARIVQSKNIKLPTSSQKFSISTSIQVEVAQDYIKLNGNKIDGLVPSNPATKGWTLLGKKIKDLQKTPEDQVVVIADQGTSYGFVDSTLAHLAKSGLSNIYLLTRKKKQN